MRVLLASPLGFLIGVSLGALGGGGSILAVPVLVYAAGQDPRAATATSLFLVGSAALVGVVAHWRAGRVRVAAGVTFGLSGIGGSLAGSALNRRADPDALLLAFAGLVLIAAWRMVTACPTCTRVGEARALGQDTSASVSSTRWASRALTVLVTGSAIGLLTGLFGVGGGFVVVPALALALKLSMPDAIGTSLVVIAINSAVALSARIATTSIDWETTLPFTVAAIAGVLAGGEIANRLDAQRSLRWFAGMLVGVAGYTAFRAGAGLA